MTLGKKDSESAKLVPGKDVEEGEPSEVDDPPSSETEKTCGHKCVGFWRCVFGFILFPLVFVLTLVAALVWCMLLPLKCCSPCCAPLFDWLVELLLLPNRFYKWVLGKKDDAEEIKS